MKVLVTGGDGFIGRHLMKLLPDAVSYDIKQGLDILDVDTLRGYAQDCDVIVHLAAKVDQVESVARPEHYYLHNIEGTMRVAQVARELGKRVVFASSSAAYDWRANPYALSKWVGEHIVVGLPDYCILRLFNVYGPGDNPDKVIPTFIRRVREGKLLTIYGDGLQVRDFVHVDDVCRVIVESLEIGSRLDVGTGFGTPIRVLAAQVAAVVGKNVPVTYLQARQEIRHSVASEGILPAVTLEDGIRELVNAHTTD